MCLDLYIRGDAAAVAYGASRGGLEFVSQRIGDVAHGAVFRPVRIVYGLHAAAAGGVVFSCGNLEFAIVGQRADALHEALSEGACADDDGPVHILKGAGYDLGRRCA